MRSLALLILGFCTIPAAAQQPAPAWSSAGSSSEAIIRSLAIRELGPTTMGGRISDLAVYESDPRIFWAATASGGLWKTTNGGTTFRPQFWNGSSAAMGAVDVSQKNPNLVWIGTGEQNSRNSSSWGDGVYKSTDGGETWQSMGLKETEHISQVIIDPRNDDVVWVAALGPLWRAGGERGVFKTMDGGRTWSKTLDAPNDMTGFVDLVMDPRNPDKLLAAAYQKERRAYRFGSGGPGSGLHMTEDGGRTWKKVTSGLPEGELGRIGLDVMRSDPKIWIASVEAGPPPARDNDAALTRGVYRSEDGGRSWKRVNTLNPRPFYFSIPRLDPLDKNRIYLPAVNFHYSEDGGKTFKVMNMNIHVDHHAMWINPKDSNHMIIGNDGGVAQTRDRGASWEMNDYIRAAQPYAVAVDMREPYWVYGGLQDNGSWAGPTQTRFGGVRLTDWRFLNGGDGFHMQADPSDWRTIYAESQGGAAIRLNQETGERRSIRPRIEGEALRFNWSTPIVLSPHNPAIVYIGANRLFRSLDRGDSWQPISPDLTTNDTEKLRRGFGVTPEATGAEMHCTIITISESPVRPGVIWTGSDDGQVQVTQDGGATWTNVTSMIPGVPDGTWVSRVHASRHAPGRCYVSMDGHRNGDMKPYAFVTEDYGQTWKPLASGLPSGHSAYVIKDGHLNENLLFLGTEMGLWMSLDRGGTWSQYEAEGFKTIRVDDLVVHPRDLDLAIATHGRGFWVMPIRGLENLTEEAKGKEIAWLGSDPALLLGFQSGSWYGGDRMWISENTQPAGHVWYWLKEKKEGEGRVVIKSVTGEAVATLRAPLEQGVNRIRWRPGRQVEAGSYAAFLSIDGVESPLGSIQVKDVSALVAW
jgi:hypothetical protein